MPLLTPHVPTEPFGPVPPDGSRRRLRVLGVPFSTTRFGRALGSGFRRRTRDAHLSNACCTGCTLSVAQVEEESKRALADPTAADNLDDDDEVDALWDNPDDDQA